MLSLHMWMYELPNIVCGPCYVHVEWSFCIHKDEKHTFHSSKQLVTFNPSIFLVIGWWHFHSHSHLKQKQNWFTWQSKEKEKEQPCHHKEQNPFANIRKIQLSITTYTKCCGAVVICYLARIKKFGVSYQWSKGVWVGSNLLRLLPLLHQDTFWSMEDI